MKLFKKILLLTTLPVVTLVVPQILSSCYEKTSEVEKKADYTKFDTNDIESVKILDNNMYDVGYAFGKDIITQVTTENQEIKIENVKFVYWDGHSSDLNENKLTKEFIIDLTKMKNLEVIHANLRYFMSGAYQGYCFANVDKINDLPKNPYFKIIFPESLKKFAYLADADVEDIDYYFGESINDIWTMDINSKDNKIINHKRINFGELGPKKDYFVEDAKYNYDFTKCVNIETFQMQHINEHENKGLYGDFVIPSSVKDLIPPPLSESSKVYFQTPTFWNKSDYSRANQKQYNLKIGFKRGSVEDKLIERKKLFLQYYVGDDEELKQRARFTKDFSFLPIEPVRHHNIYYENIYIDSTFKDIDGLKLLFGGPKIQNNFFLCNLNDDIHNEWFGKMISENKIYCYDPETKKISNNLFSKIVWSNN